ncbi:MAG: DUF1858 domain-containing protein [Clostridia bacterium]|nr:DUF1858 domain-containing protein [Clostridia bacterium]MBR5942251.1 DUF1858 domain-containing protein [Clostridia bacterium]
MCYNINIFTKGSAIMVDKDWIIGAVLDRYPDTAELFLGIGMHCLGCPGARSETIEQACMVHGADCDALVDEINALIGA